MNIRLAPRALVALAVAALVLVVLLAMYLGQQADQQRQLDAIDLGVSCQIAGGHVVQQGNLSLCVDDAGRVVTLPAK